MVSRPRYLRNVALFLPGESLVKQVMKWSQRHRTFALQIVQTSLADAAGEALDSADFTLIDATEEPEGALAVLAQGIAQEARPRLGVYTEVMHSGLEIPVRSHGVHLYLGPLGQSEWEGVFAGMVPGEVAVRA